MIGAEQDILVPVWKSRELAELIPGAELTVIEGSPHGATLERAEEFNAAVLDFIAAPDSRARLGDSDSSATAVSRSASSGAARVNSTISSTLATGSPAGATTRSS